MIYANLIYLSEMDLSDDNSGYYYGIQLLDEDYFCFDSLYFKTEAERENYLIENSVYLLTY